MRYYFLDPEGNTMFFTAVVDADAPLPEGMQMQNRGSWLHGQPRMPGEYEITVTATDISEPPGQSETARQTFTLYVLHEDPRIVNVIDEQLLDIPDHLLDFDNRMIGSPIHKDIFDITANVEVETIGEFVQNQDKIFLGDTVTNVWISKGANGEWHLYDDAARGDADLLARVFIKAEEGAMPTLQPADFDAHSLDDDDFADVNVAVTIVQPDII